MFYTIYKITNTINEKFYIGKHKTKDLNDGYMGSGTLLRRAINKHGIDNFHKEILFVCESETHMNLLEKILVVPDSELNYNLCPGGKGGWGYVNSLPEKKEYLKKAYKSSNLGQYNYTRDTSKLSERNRLFHRIGKFRPLPKFTGKKHKEESKRLIGEKNSKHQQGSKNSQFGTVWIHNGITNKKVKKEELDFYLLQGYTKGRI